ncbi:YggU family protein [Candidatus Woesearchaeota archaeon]|nr:YggU family protein [Candidatus Woesearchaeota archaeon]
MQIREKSFRVIIKPNSSKNEIISFDKDKKAYKVNIKEKAEDNKANKELLRFLSKYLGKRVKIKSGLKSREKLIEVIDYSGGI